MVSQPDCFTNAQNKEKTAYKNTISHHELNGTGQKQAHLKKRNTKSITSSPVADTRVNRYLRTIDMTWRGTLCMSISPASREGQGEEETSQRICWISLIPFS